MTTLLFLLLYTTGFFIGLGVGSRLCYNLERRHRPDARAVAIYQDAVLQGAVIGLLWPVALPLLCLFGIGWQAARIAAPAEVRKEVNAYNTRMMERMLGQKDEEFEKKYALDATPWED